MVLKCGDFNRKIVSPRKQSVHITRHIKTHEINVCVTSELCVSSPKRRRNKNRPYTRDNFLRDGLLISRCGREVGCHLRFCTRVHFPKFVSFYTCSRGRTAFVFGDRLKLNRNIIFIYFYNKFKIYESVKNLFLCSR